MHPDKSWLQVEYEVIALGPIERPQDADPSPHSPVNDRGLRYRAFLICRQHVLRIEKVPDDRG